jgi:hypothetical protein
VRDEYDFSKSTENPFIKNQVRYVEETDAPDDVREGFDRAIIVPNFRAKSNSEKKPVEDNF